MSFLDTSKARQDDAKLVALHEILIRAYPEKIDALAIAGSVGILQADIGVYPKMRHTWWSILEEAAGDHILRRLVYNVLQDPTISAFHVDVRTLLDVPESALDGAAQQPTTPLEKGYLPTIGEQAPIWPAGHTLQIRFLDGAAKLHKLVERAAQQWVDYANLKLDFGDHADAEIRVSFKQSGSWAFVGTTCLAIKDPQPNVNFGWLTAATPVSEIQRVVLHEFGHVLGFQHEQGNPASTLAWNKQIVYQEMGGAPNHWTRAMVDQNFFKIWPPGYFSVYKLYDPASIMMLPIAKQFLRSGLAVGWNRELSTLDKQFAAAIYPLR